MQAMQNRKPKNWHCVCLDKSKPKPKWLTQPLPKNATVRQIRTREYWSHIWTAQPAYADRDAIKAIYLEAAQMRERGFDVEVDHIIPLRHPLISGLHVPNNLRIISRKLNQSKSNDWYPGMAYEQLSMLDDDYCEPEDFTLKVH